MRSATWQSDHDLTQSLLLPAAAPSADGRREKRTVYDGIVFVPNVAEARRRVLAMLPAGDREAVLVPPFADHDLLEMIKRSGATTRFGEIDERLRLQYDPCQRVAWLRSPLGLPLTNASAAALTVRDYGDSVPDTWPPSALGSDCANVSIFGLYLTSASATAGALIHFDCEMLLSRYLRRYQRVDLPDRRLLARQLARLPSLIKRQRAALDFVATGLQQAAGLPTMLPGAGGGLGHGVAVRIPDEGSATTFWAYLLRENTPAYWLPQLCPIHYRAIAAGTRATAELERWLFIPVTPEQKEAARLQAVLGVVKVAEYMGLRWGNQPKLAAEYARLLVRMYGPDHDAYRPVFATDVGMSLGPAFALAEASAPVCQLVS